MAKRGKHYGFVAARVNTNVESRSIIADALALDTERNMAEDGLPVTCVNAGGMCCPCCGCYCPPFAKFAQDFNAKNGKTLKQIWDGYGRP